MKTLKKVYRAHDALSILCEEGQDDARKLRKAGARLLIALTDLYPIIKVERGNGFKDRRRARAALDQLDAACNADEGINQNRRIGRAMRLLEVGL